MRDTYTTLEGCRLVFIMKISNIHPRAGSALEVLLVFFRLGLTSFGGPVAHLGYFRAELVDRRRWIGEPEYGELIALSQFLPGPGSSQVGFALGKIRAGYMGAICAWIGFTLPSAALMVAAAFGAPLLAGAFGLGALAGLHAVAVAVVAVAVWGMARTLTPDIGRVAIAGCALALALTVHGVLGQLLALVAGLALGLLVCRPPNITVRSTDVPLLGVSRRAGAWCLATTATLLTALPLVAVLTENSLVRLADTFVRAGAFVFGGGHVLLPLLQADSVIALGVDSDQFLAGYSAAQAAPGPLFTFAAYLGAALHPGAFGLLTATIALVAVFLPGLLLMLGIAPFWESLRKRPRAWSAIAGINASVVGILAAAFVDPVVTVGITSVASSLVAVGALALLVWKTPPWLVVALGAGVGIVLAAAGT